MKPESVTTPIKLAAMTPYEGWRFLFDKQGAVHHVPDKELLDEMCKLYYGDMEDEQWKDRNNVAGDMP